MPETTARLDKGWEALRRLCEEVWDIGPTLPRMSACWVSKKGTSGTPSTRGRHTTTAPWVWAWSEAAGSPMVTHVCLDDYRWSAYPRQALGGMTQGIRRAL